MQRGQKPPKVKSADELTLDQLDFKINDRLKELTSLNEKKNSIRVRKEPGYKIKLSEITNLIRDKERVYKIYVDIREVKTPFFEKLPQDS